MRSTPRYCVSTSTTVLWKTDYSGNVCYLVVPVSTSLDSGVGRMTCKAKTNGFDITVWETRVYSQATWEYIPTFSFCKFLQEELWAKDKMSGRRNLKKRQSSKHRSVLCKLEIMLAFQIAMWNTPKFYWTALVRRETVSYYPKASVTHRRRLDCCLYAQYQSMTLQWLSVSINSIKSKASMQHRSWF